MDAMGMNQKTKMTIEQHTHLKMHATSEWWFSIGMLVCWIRLYGIHNETQYTIPSLKLTAISPLKIDAWNTTLLLGFGLFLGV